MIPDNVIELNKGETGAGITAVIGIPTTEVQQITLV